MRKVELFIESIIFYSRWLLAPFYIGLALSLLLLLFNFVMKFASFVGDIRSLDGPQVILGVLNLIDLTFTGNLVLIVIFSGYENFVSRIETAARDRPEWMTKVDFGGLKQKLMISIVAISAITVLEAFMNLDQIKDTSKLGWLVGIHGVFLVSLLVVAVSDRLAGDKNEPSAGKK